MPLQIWWSPQDKIVIDQQRQAARLVQLDLEAEPEGRPVGFTGGWSHSAEMRAKTRLPLALAMFGLLPGELRAPGRAAGDREVAAERRRPGGERSLLSKPRG